MIYLVLGCHKSGTTLVAEILHRSGIPMIEGDVGETDYDRGDFFERLDWVYLNQDILGFGDPAETFSAPTKVSASDAQRRSIVEYVETCQKAHENWGFKDPRMCLAYPIWREHLPEHVPIGVYRSLSEVWAHQARQGRRIRSLWKAVRMWCDYNWRLADILERRRQLGQPYLLLKFEDLMTGDEELGRLEAFLDRPIVDPRRAGRYRSRSRGRRLLGIVDAVMDACGLANPSLIEYRLESLRRSE
ncbi:MAG: hypothetical protein JRG92_22015 [Deltaproteobacteria bacterium]|nr:hypothetical protein [Deltaproteobacteria bacterium]